MIEKRTVTAALLAVGVLVSSAYTAVAQQNQPNTVPAPQGQPNTVPGQQNQLNTVPGQQNQPMAVPAQQNPATLSALDRQFMIQAAQGGIGEVILGNLAAQRAVNNNVKQYGQMMVQDHTQANTELMQLAAQKGVTLPTDTDAKHKALRARLGQIPGRRMDRTYIREMIKDHAMTVALFQREARQGRDPDVRAFATRNLPTVQQHLQMARQMANNI
ncbi:MAG TPA: DUF4142 domain-containing protein [Candidatus Obscuribacterales bacterium]